MMKTPIKIIFSFIFIAFFTVFLSGCNTIQGVGKDMQEGGRQLQKVAVLNDYWFDWKTYHPSTAVYELGER